MESMAYLSHNGCISIREIDGHSEGITAADFLPILNSPTILQCRYLQMINADFPYKDYKVLYDVNVFEITHIGQENDPNRYLDFLEKPGVKPIVALLGCSLANIITILDGISKVFSSATVPNAFKIVFAQYNFNTVSEQFLTEFREMNKISGEKLELKEGVPLEYRHRLLEFHEYYTLERSRL
ncbi:hypothetical protein DdX_15959 [Ditylenchus destructor]|uniref:Uncharacterized protein n=1 Tax=Ditylenchus destructor TaxID=166010 RepID=A0AAD4MRS3_9BILA|nr:hypothetical protein DdX_15959 [Ditylenchus destructor]